MQSTCVSLYRNVILTNGLLPSSVPYALYSASCLSYMFVCGGARQLQLSLLSLSLSALEPKALYELGHPHSLASSKSTETQMAGMGL